MVVGPHPPPVKIMVNLKEAKAERPNEDGEIPEEHRLESIQMMAKRLKNEGVSKERARQMIK